MARAQDDSSSLRFSRRECERLLVALLWSLLMHLAAWSTYHTGHKLGWWQKWHPPVWLQPEAKKHASPTPLAPASEPTIFVDVSHADADAPANPKYYSNKNSRAANPDMAMANVPKINGRQTDVPKTEDAPKPAKLQPAVPPPQPLQPQIVKSGQTANPADEPEPPPGDLSPRKKKSGENTAQNQADRPPQPERPRTLKQVQPSQALPGRQMQQAGGVARRALVSSLDAKATPFGEYDSAIVAAVTQHWYDLLDSSKFAMDRTGRVTLQFRLYSDGRVVEMKTTENNVGPLLGYVCQEAIEQSAPFAKWPPDMLRMIGANYREITFSFYYY